MVTPARRVLYVANSSRIGGGNRVLMELIDRLDPARFIPHLIVPGPGPLVDWAADHDIPYATVSGEDFSGRAGLWIRAAKMLRLVLQWHPAIVHASAHTCYAAAGLAAGVTGAIRICHLGCPPTEEELAWNFRSGPDSVIACYDGQARTVAATISRVRPSCRVTSVPNGVDLNRFRPGTMSATAATLRGGATRVVAIVGNLSDVKGHPTFIRAAARISARFGSCRFLLAGGDIADEGWQGRLHGLAQELGIDHQVSFLGWQNDVRAVFEAADVVALPSRNEGLPLALLEAMACGKPVVATPVGGVPEAVIDGVTGHLVPPDDPEQLARALIRLLEDRGEAKRIGAAARERVEARFSLDRHAAAVQALYDDVRRLRSPLSAVDRSPHAYVENR